MYLSLLALSIFLLPGFVVAQQIEPELSATNEQQIENMTANNDDIEAEDDTYLQEMQQFIKDPINLNTADEATLKELQILSPLQIQHFIMYRTLLGKLINIYELQAVPGWDIATINRIRPYVKISMMTNAFESLRKRMEGGDKSILLRATQILERAKGYTPDTSKSYYQGSAQKIFLRYRYNYKNVLQYGIVAEKDAGEQFFKGGQKLGFDHYSAHFFAKDLGIIRSLAVGDFTMNLGQGLISWQSLAFKKGPDVMNIKRQAAVLRPYNSAGEINFHRGIGITVAKHDWEATLFASYKKIDGNLSADTAMSQDSFITSLQTSGYHRTKNELADKGVQQQLAFGGNISYRYKQLRIGINSVQYKFKLPIIKGNEPYNKYALSGDRFGNNSIDYSYTYKNLHFFGEAAVTNDFYMAFINGVLVSVASNVDLSFLYRNIDEGYHSLYSSAFTEGSYPTNEKGLYAGISCRPAVPWRIDAYLDMYKFPWLRYRVDRPSTGSDHMIQLTYTPNKQLEIYTRYRSEAKALNANPDDQVLSPVPLHPKQSWRININYAIGDAITLRNRVETVWYDKKGPQAETGFLGYFDVLFKPLSTSFSGSIRLQYFETDGYNSRLYAYENDVLYSYSTPVFYDKGYRYYINCDYSFGKNISVWARFARTAYPRKNTIGSGLDEIKGNSRTEVRLQVQYKL